MHLMKNIIPVYKPIGITPLQTIQLLKKQHPEYKDSAITYAGRLDPMAHGVLLLLADQAIKQKATIMNMNKAYTVSILLGLETDTFDILGLVLSNTIQKPPTNFFDNINQNKNQFIGGIQQEYPPYSSKTVQGKPLFWWSRNNKLSDITLPTHQVTIHSLDTIDSTYISAPNLLNQITANIALITGDFRQKEIIKQWRKVLDTNQTYTFPILNVIVDCSSGTYMRSIAHQIGKILGCGGIAIEILRTQVGPYTIPDCLTIQS